MPLAKKKKTKKRWLKTLEVTPPGGWRFVDPDTKLVIQEKDFSRLKWKVASHRKYEGNGLGGYPDEIEHQICARVDDSWSQDKPRKN